MTFFFNKTLEYRNLENLFPLYYTCIIFELKSCGLIIFLLLEFIINHNNFSISPLHEFKCHVSNCCLSFFQGLVFFLLVCVHFMNNTMYLIAQKSRA